MTSRTTRPRHLPVLARDERAFEALDIGIILVIVGILGFLVGAVIFASIPSWVWIVAVVVGGIVALLKFGGPQARKLLTGRNLLVVAVLAVVALFLLPSVPAVENAFTPQEARAQDVTVSGEATFISHVFSANELQFTPPNVHWKDARLLPASLFSLCAWTGNRDITYAATLTSLNDSSISYTASGKLGTFCFFNNGGDTQSYSFTFAKVAPGTYTLKIQAFQPSDGSTPIGTTTLPSLDIRHATGDSR